MMRLAAMVGALALGACSSEPASDAAVANVGVDGAVRPAVDPRTRTASPTGPVLTQLPAAFHGRWGLVPADCEAGRSDAKGLITVAPKLLTFYESRGVPETITQTAPNAVSMDVAYTGEGQSWRKTVRLSTRDAVLVHEEDEPMLSQTYRRCPA